MDWLAGRQEKIEDALAARHLAEGTLVLYDMSSAAFEGRTCPLGAIGHPKDGVHGRLQIVYGLLTSKEGIPVAIEVFNGNTGDPTTVAAQVSKLKDRFGVARVVLAGDRGMLTATRLREDIGPAKLDWITALRAPQVKALVRDGALQLSLFDQMDLAEITHPDFPGERMVACMNPLLEAERARKRESLLAGTEAGLAKITAATQRAGQPLRGKDKIALRADRVLRRRKVAKHFRAEITHDSFSYARDQDSITAEAALDGIYVLRTSVAGSSLASGEVVSSYKALPASSAGSLVVHRSGDIGSPRSCGSTRASSAGRSPGSASAARLRPPPGLRAPPSGSAPESSSLTPSDTVASRTPAARATSRIPPCRSVRASAPISSRRCRSSRCGKIDPNLAASACLTSSLPPIPHQHAAFQKATGHFVASP
jgi:hypothetical protein